MITVKPMEIYLYNTLSGQKEEFKSLREGQAGVYSCGPTVYNFAHIGNFRTFIFNDILRRTLEWNGFTVEHVMNITDVDDKTIKKSREEGVSLGTFTRKYEHFFWDDLQELNILRPQKTPRATESIDEMIELIKSLLDKDVAYEASDGIYFNIAKFPDYGALAKLDFESSSKERVSNDEYDKENARDFALWKFHTEEDGEVSFEAPFGRGRPGWHIECSAMSMKNLGETFDIHTGGADLVFPHHENEIAQSQAATGKKFVNYWLHGGFITVDGKKMSKSLGNAFILKDLKAKGFHPLSYRYFVLGGHYRTLLNFTWEALQSAQTSLQKLAFEFENLPEGEADKPTLDKFRELINDDLNTPQTLALLHEAFSSKKSKKTIAKMDEVLGLDIAALSRRIAEIPAEILSLKAERDGARAAKDFTRSDALRSQIENLGYIVEDTTNETHIRKSLSALV